MTFLLYELVTDVICLWINLLLFLLLTASISLYRIYWMVFLMEAHIVLCKVRTDPCYWKFVVQKVALWQQVFLSVLGFSPVRVIAPVLHCHCIWNCSFQKDKGAKSRRWSAAQKLRSARFYSDAIRNSVPTFYAYWLDTVPTTGAAYLRMRWGFDYEWCILTLYTPS